MPLWTCDIADCEYPSVRVAGDCTFCNRHLCYQHLKPDFHDCPRLEDDDDACFVASRKAEQAEITQLVKKIQLSNLAAEASRLRHGVPCEASPLLYDQATRSSFMGGMNVHVELRFRDGEIWLARIRRVNAASPPPLLRDYIIHSEIATLRFLERVAIPTPRVMGFALEGEKDNTVGVGYMLIEQLPGTSMRWSLATTVQRQNVMDQLAGIFIETSKYPLRAMGSLHHLGETDIGPMAKEEISCMNGHYLQLSGPFSSLQDYHSTHINAILGQIPNREMYLRKAVDAYLIHRFLLDLVPHFASTPHSPCFVRHADDKGDHILVDEDYNITGIIDWEWAYAAPPPVAFNSPIVLFDVAKFYDGDINISDDEEYFAHALESRGADDLASCVRKGRSRHFYHFCCGYDLEADWDGFKGLFQGLRRSVGMDGESGWADWRSEALKRYCEDEGLKSLLEEGSGPGA